MPKEYVFKATFCGITTIRLYLQDPVQFLASLLYDFPYQTRILAANYERAELALFFQLQFWDWNLSYQMQAQLQGQFA